MVYTHELGLFILLKIFSSFFIHWNLTRNYFLKMTTNTGWCGQLLFLPINRIYMVYKLVSHVQIVTTLSKRGFTRFIVNVFVLSLVVLIVYLLLILYWLGIRSTHQPCYPCCTINKNFVGLLPVTNIFSSMSLSFISCFYLIFNFYESMNFVNSYIVK